MISLRLHQRIQKRLFDFVFSFLLLCIFLPVIFLAWIIASIDTRSNGLFRQVRIGRHATPFIIYKIKTMQPHLYGHKSQFLGSLKISRSGVFFRRFKIDELPQLYNIFIGNMSFVGPRPDLPGYADKLVGDDRSVLSIRPGLTGPASIKYRDEEALLLRQTNPRYYNDNIIWPDKVRINLSYLASWSFLGDLRYLFYTFLRL